MATQLIFVVLLLSDLFKRLLVFLLPFHREVDLDFLEHGIPRESSEQVAQGPHRQLEATDVQMCYGVVF